MSHTVSLWAHLPQQVDGHSDVGVVVVMSHTVSLWARLLQVDGQGGVSGEGR